MVSDIHWCLGMYTTQIRGDYYNNKTQFGCRTTAMVKETEEVEAGIPLRKLS